MASPSRYERTRCFRRGWVFERVGWVAMAGIVAAAALGLLGDGWLSAATASAGDALTVEYPRFGRAHAPLVVDVDWLPQGEDATLWIARSYLEEFAIEEIRPMPAAVSAGLDRIYYVFRNEAPEARIRVRFRLKPERGGTILGRLGADDERAVEVRQLVFP